MNRLRIAAAGSALLALVACAEPVPDIPPRQLEASPFHYPEDLWDAEVEGETILRLMVTREGGVDSVRVERSSGYPAFDSAAVSGARDLRFEPARRGDETIPVWVLLPVEFELPADTSSDRP